MRRTDLTSTLTFGYPTDRQIGRDTNFMAECAGQTRQRQQPNPVEYIRFALGFANAGQIGRNYCEQNASSRINTESEALVCLNLDVMMCRIKLVKSG